ncbi:hypothetical protein D3C85_1589410 [compost metagenome]
MPLVANFSTRRRNSLVAQGVGFAVHISLGDRLAAHQQMQLYRDDVDQPVNRADTRAMDILVVRHTVATIGRRGQIIIIGPVNRIAVGVRRV